MRKSLSLLVLAALLALPAAVGAAPDVTEWNVDPNHSEVNFQVRHFFTPVTGTFQEFEIEFLFDPDNPAASSVTATIPVGSISTGNERRDNHLKSGDFFEAEAHPTMTFVSERVEAMSDSEWVAHGTLTIKGVSRDVELRVEKLGVMDLPEQMAREGATKVGSFRASTTIQRNDFNVGTGSWAETAVVGGDVEIEILVEARGA